MRLALPPATVVLIEVADAADEHELIFGSRRKGLYYAGGSFANKAAAGLGTLIAGATLQIIGFAADLAETVGVRSVLLEHTVALLRAATGPRAASLYVTGLIFSFSYGIDKRGHASIIVQLEDWKRLA